MGGLLASSIPDQGCGGLFRGRPGCGEGLCVVGRQTPPTPIRVGGQLGEGLWKASQGEGPSPDEDDWPGAVHVLATGCSGCSGHFVHSGVPVAWLLYM